MASDDEADLQDENEYIVTGKCGIIFLIDARLSMFTKDFVETDEEQTRFNIALKCLRTVVMNKIISNQKDLVGLVLFGTDRDDPTSKTKHVTQLLDLNYPCAKAVSMLDNLMAESQHPWGSSRDFLLADALWYCSSMFSHSGTNLSEKRILLFTDDDDPHSYHADRAHMARKRANDLNQIGISLELLAMKQDFDYSKFYKELVETINGTTDTDVGSYNRLEELLERINRLDFKSRRYAKIKWDLGKGVCVGLSLYTLYRETKIISKELLNRSTNEPVKRVRQILDQGTGELLLPSDIEHYCTVAGQDIVFTDEDKEIMRKITEPGITLLGFKPLSMVSEGLHCGYTSFAYPEETLVKGSQQFVKAMVERCIARQKVPLCCLTPRNRAATKYVCLLPSPGHGDQPLGFHVIPLPFYRDTREQTPVKSSYVDEKTIEVAKKLINKLKFGYKLSKFKNPKLQQFWAYLEALALEYDVPDNIEDDTEVPVEDQSRRLGQLSEQFNSACRLSGARSATGRKRSSTTTHSHIKRSKVEAGDCTPSIKDAIKKGKGVEKFTVPQLKTFLMDHDQSVEGMKKADLVKAVYSLKL